MTRKRKNLIFNFIRHWKRSKIYKILFYQKKEKQLLSMEQHKKFIEDNEKTLHPEIAQHYKEKVFKEKKDYEWGRDMKISLVAGLISGLVSGGIITLIQLFIFQNKE